MHFKSVFATLLTLFVFAIPTATAPSAERVQDLFGVLRTGNFTDFYALLSPSSTWDTIGFGVRTRDQTIEVFKEINCLLSNPPLRIETDLVLSQGWSSTHTSVKAHVPNGIIGTNGVQYNQTYSWIMTWHGETILSTTEYINDFLARDLIGGNMGGC